jgi:hypothetical protein
LPLVAQLHEPLLNFQNHPIPSQVK